MQSYTVKICTAPTFGTDVSRKHVMWISSSCHPAREGWGKVVGWRRWEQPPGVMANRHKSKRVGGGSNFVLGPAWCLLRRTCELNKRCLGRNDIGRVYSGSTLIECWALVTNLWSNIVENLNFRTVTPLLDPRNPPPAWECKSYAKFCFDWIWILARSRKLAVMWLSWLCKEKEELILLANEVSLKMVMISFSLSLALPGSTTVVLSIWSNSLM